LTHNQQSIQYHLEYQGKPFTTKEKSRWWLPIRLWDGFSIKWVKLEATCLSLEGCPNFGENVPKSFLWAALVAFVF
jgi:hypothetical protein